MELTATLIGSLQAFQFKKTSKLDPPKFIDLYTTWMKVYTHLKAVGQEAALNHGPMLYMVTKKLSEDMLRECVRVIRNTKDTGEFELNAMHKFMTEEREKQ